MKKILFGLALLISFSVNAQIRVCQLPQVTSGTLNDYIIKEDSTCHGTRKIKISDFIATYSLGGGGGSTDTTSLSNRINNKIDTLYKNSTGDSFIYKINGRRHALVDSTGSSTGSVSPIESSWTDALGRIGSIVAGQAYKVNNDDSNLPAGVDYILVWGLDATNYNTNGQAYLTGLGIFPCTYELVGNTFLAILKQRLMIEDFGGTLAVTKIYDDYPSITYTINIASSGEAVYNIAASSSIWTVGSYQTIFMPHPYYNLNQDPCVGYGEIMSSNEVLVKGTNTSLGGTVDSDGQLQPYNLYVDIETIFKN